jgi:hypothetical protein
MKSEPTVHRLSKQMELPPHDPAVILVCGLAGRFAGLLA